MFTYGSVCSGIEAASVAWDPLGAKPVWFSEIEPFPCAVLAHRFPDVPNLGDMTAIAARIRDGSVVAPDVLVGGTPCQAFSVAGARAGLSDPRGQLTLAYVDIADAIDSVRAVRGEQPVITLWENVPGVLSSKDNAFGCFLGVLAGEDCELQPPGGKWADAGCVFGPSRAVAWRILDAQYFGLAQRRRRVFVVSSARTGFDPAAVLFEFDRLRRDTPPSRGARTAVAALTANGVGTCGADDNQGQAGHLIPAEGCGWDGHENLISFYPTQDPISSEDGITHAMGCGSSSGQASVGVAYPLLEVGKRTGASTTDTRAGIGIGSDADPMFTLQAGAQHGVAVAISLRGREGGATAELGDEVQNCLRASSGGGDKAHVLAPVCVTGDVTHPLKAEGFDGSEDRTGRGQPIVAAPEMAVRRLTPRECERLQGFPDDWTLVPVRGKPAADGPRYKALGNSMAVPVMRWIGERIVRCLGVAA